MPRRLRKLLARRRGSPPPAPAPPTSDAPPGSRRLERSFFDEHPRFLDTSETSARPWRLNLRHAAIFDERPGLFDGASVLDIASHDGRWSLAALDAGARHVLGIEPRPDLVENAAASLTASGLADDRWEFRAGSVFDVLRDEDIRVDVVLCLGFIYHTLRYPELWTRMRECRPEHIVVDTLVEPGRRPLIRVTKEQVTKQANAAVDDYTVDDFTLTGRPTVLALRRMARIYGYRLAHRSDWPALLRDNPDADGVRDYREGRRVTLFFERD